MKNIFLLSSMNFFPNIVETIRERIPDVLVTNNFEEVKALVTLQEVKAMCILSGAYNYAKAPCNTITAQHATKEFHAVNPAIPILVWNGFKEEIPEDKIVNERYLVTDDLSREDFYKITEDFFKAASGIYVDKVPRI